MGRLWARRRRSSLVAMYALLGLCNLALAMAGPSVFQSLAVFVALTAVLLAAFHLRWSPAIACGAMAMAAAAVLPRGPLAASTRLVLVLGSGLCGLAVGLATDRALLALARSWRGRSKGTVPIFAVCRENGTVPSGRSSDGQEGPILAEVVRPPAAIYSVPRRYDLAMMLSAFVGYALLFGLMKVLEVPPVVFALVALFFTAVGVGQAVLFGGKNPRLASQVVGVAFFVVLAVAVLVLSLIGFFPDGDPLAAICLLFALAASGFALGYAAGVFVASVFMFADMGRKALRRLRRLSESEKDRDVVPKPERKTDALPSP